MLSKSQKLCRSSMSHPRGLYLLTTLSYIVLLVPFGKVLQVFAQGDLGSKPKVALLDRCAKSPLGKHSPILSELALHAANEDSNPFHNLQFFSSYIVCS